MKQENKDGSKKKRIAVSPEKGTQDLKQASTNSASNEVLVEVKQSETPGSEKPRVEQNTVSEQQSQASAKGHSYPFSRRRFLLMVSPVVAGVLAKVYLPDQVFAFSALEPIDTKINPLETYPNRDWEDVYRDIYTPDYTFHYLCSPNCTVGCLLKASVKNGVLRYVDPSFGYHNATDMYGNHASSRWDPRACISGLSYVRRFYSDRRVKNPFIRKGFKAWVDDGYPRDPETGLPPQKYLEGRGKDDWITVSWDEVFQIIAATMVNITKTYSGDGGKKLLLKQNYDPAMVEATEGAGVRTLKTRGGMPFLGTMRLTGMYRFANMLSLLDSHVRNLDAAHAKGGRTWDSYSWHTDLPPGHPMVTGIKTSDFDLFTAENAKVITMWGMNWISTKMPDAHWITEARIKGAKLITIATEYQSTSNKADEVIILRPGTDAALAFGVAQVLIKEKLYDEEFIKSYTDLPLLIRMDTLKRLNARDVISNYKPAELSNFTRIIKPDEHETHPAEQDRQLIPEAIRNEWGDYTVWDSKKGSAVVVTRDQVGKMFNESGIDSALEGEFEVKLVDGSNVKVRPVFDLIREYLDNNFDPDTASEVTWTPKEAITNLARTIAANKRGGVLFATGMGPNHYFNNDLKDRAIFLLASLSANEGFFGGDVGSYSGNHRIELFNGVMEYYYEDPFNIEADLSKPTNTKHYAWPESAHYYNYGDRPLRVGNKLFTGKTHMPTPTKVAWWANANSILGNAKWAYDVIMNTLPRIEMVVVNDWFWSATCEYSDIVLGVDSWCERKLPDIYGSCTNPFVQAAPRTPLPKMFDTKDDLECYYGVAEKLSGLTGDDRFKKFWSFVPANKVDAVIDRVLVASNATKGYTFKDIEESCKNGTPFYMATRTTPRITGWEQVNESKPWYTKSGRLEFYRDEDEWIEYGENLPVFRECPDSTYHEPFVIVSKPHPAVKPKPPQEYGLDPNDLSVEVRQVRNVAKPWSEVKNTKHPLMKDGFTHILYTPKYRHAAHTTAASTDIEVAFFGPFGDFYRHDKRKPWVSEGYVDLNPLDAKELGIEDGDYIWVDGDPSDRPFRGWQKRSEDYRVMRWMVRARYYPNIPRRTARAWFHFYIATHGSVQGAETRPDGLAKNPKSGYQAAYRYGSHQSITRAWLRTTLMTDSLVRKEYHGQLLGKGFAPDIHCVAGAPKESFVKISKAEAGGIDGKGLWDPAAAGFRPTYENDIVKKYLKGEFVTVK